MEKHLSSGSVPSPAASVTEPAALCRCPPSSRDHCAACTVTPPQARLVSAVLLTE